MRVFLSWSNELSKYVAEQFDTLLTACFPKKLVAPFFSCNMAGGTRSMDKILSELKNSSHLLAFLTRDELNPAWVIFESGAVGKFAKQSTIVPIAIGFCAGDVVPPLQATRQSISIDDKFKVRGILDDICKSARASRAKLDQRFNAWFRKLQSELKRRQAFDLTGGTGDWKLVHRGLIAEQTARSPFEASDALRIARKHVVVTGQNLYTLIGIGEGVSPIENHWFFKQSVDFLKGARANDGPKPKDVKDRKLDILVLDPKKKQLVSAWGTSIGNLPEFRSHLELCVAALPKFKKLAMKHGVGKQVTIRLARYLPLSTVFVDPEDRVHGMLFLRAFTREDEPRERPIVLFTQRENPTAFGYYWNRHHKDFTGQWMTRSL